jgi:uncharacterized protein YjeT (DUF2065 family)
VLRWLLEGTGWLLCPQTYKLMVNQATTAAISSGKRQMV